jgi:hypothetical protein
MANEAKPYGHHHLGITRADVDVSLNDYLMSRRGCSLPANASGFDPHRASIISRFGQVFAHASGDGHHGGHSQHDPAHEERPIRIQGR